MVAGRILALAVVLAVGCTSAGWDFESETARGVVVGVDDKASVQAELGPPRSQGPVPKGALPGCVERWMYRYARFGLFSDSVKVLVVDFDAAGVVCYRGYAED